MIAMFFAMLSSTFSCSQSVLTKTASHKISEGGLCFNALKVASAFAFFLLFSMGRINFHYGTVFSALVYSVSLSASTLFGYFALKLGSMTLTALIVSYSVTIPCFYGIMFFDEKLNLIQIVGLILLVVSLFFVLKTKEESGRKMNLKWLMCVVVTLFCNGICAVTQKVHQTMYPGEFCNEFMLFSLLFSSVVFFVITLLKKEKTSKGQLKYAIPSGVLMGLGNYLTLVMASKVKATVLFPMVTVISVVLNTTASKLIFKDKLTVSQTAGIIIGVISVILIK